MLSVIIPTYNFGPYLKQCVDSVLAQKTEFEFDIIISDDFSTDNTREILNQEYSQNPKIKIFYSSSNRGPFENIKFAFGQSSSKYISYLDGDDYFSYELKLQKQVDFLENNHDYVLHATGNNAIDEKGNIFPHGTWGSWYVPLIQDVSTSDLLKNNYVGFGRTFRNIPELLKEWMKSCPYLDWVTNFELSLHGKLKCEKWCSGVYRQHSDGMFSQKPEHEKQQTGQKIREILLERYRRSSKKITIIDCFIRNERIENKLLSLLKKLKEREEDVLLISNTIPSNDTLKFCDFFLYDKRNKLFEEEYTGVKTVDFFLNAGYFSIHNLRPGMQRHGLSVLINLANSVDFAKNLGYTYFQRIEVDDLFGEKSLYNTDQLFSSLLLSGKKGLFYFNESEQEKNISFHFFLCEIDLFISQIPRIKSEEDFKKWLLETQGNLDFVIAEEFIYKNLIPIRDQLLEKNGQKMDEDFPDTVWNTETSGSNLDSKYSNCLTGIYKKINSENLQIGYCVLSYNYGNESKDRKIICFTESEKIKEFTHSLPCHGAWTYNDLPENCDKIEVWENESLLYHEFKEKAISYLQF